MSKASLNWDRFVVPVLDRFCADLAGDPQMQHGQDLVGAGLGAATAKFDARPLDPQFVYETGDERLAEFVGNQKMVHLPFSTCMFEFTDFCVVADELEYVDEGEHIVVFQAFPRDVSRHWLDQFADATAELVTRAHDDRLQADEAQWRSDRAPFPYEPIQGINSPPDWLPDAVKMTLGVLGLMEEKLLRQAKTRVASGGENALRKRQGKHAITSHKVLTLNLAETRRRAAATAIKSHESPRLHWRRGHWRTLGRMSEFESRTWVRKALVGDAAKGFAAKTYRLAWQQHIH